MLSSKFRLGIAALGTAALLAGIAASGPVFAAKKVVAGGGGGAVPPPVVGVGPLLAFPGTLPTAANANPLPAGLRTSYAPIVNAGLGLGDPSIPLGATPATLDIRFQSGQLKVSVNSIDPKLYPAGCNVTLAFEGPISIPAQTVPLAAAVAPAVGNTAGVAIKTTQAFNGVGWAAMSCDSVGGGKVKVTTTSKAAFAGAAM